MVLADVVVWKLGCGEVAGRSCGVGSSASPGRRASLNRASREVEVRSSPPLVVKFNCDTQKINNTNLALLHIITHSVKRKMSLFGSAFGGGANNLSSNTAQKPSLFGSSFGQGQNNNTQTPNQNQSQGLFGQSTNTNTQTQNQSTSLFGQPPNTNNQQQNQSTSLFGGQSTTQNQGFGAQQQQPNTSLFGNPNQSQHQQQSQQPQQQQQQNLLSSNIAGGLSASTTNGGAIADYQLRELAAQRLAAHNLNNAPREKTIPEQLSALMRKWDPNSQDTLLQQYLYNNVLPAYAPFYYPRDDESHTAWEEALAKKPSTKDSEGEELGCAWVPVLCRGFKALGERVEYQANAVQAMRARMHEINNSLTAIMEKHRQDFTVALEGARRQHTNLAERTLRLACKVQVLRNRGYELTSAEEVLRRQLLELEGRALDPGFAAREEEIWARMVALRERARWLEEEGKRVGEKVEQQGQGAKALPEYVVAKTKKILRDYDDQISHLAKELEVVKKEYAEWQESRKC